MVCWKLSYGAGCRLIAHRNAGVGQVGAGLVRPPLVIFEQALLAYAEKYQL